METKKSIFETVYEIHANMVYRLAFSYLKHKEDAEDVVQEVFTKYVCGLRLPMSPEHEKAWFVRVTINQCKDLMRRRKLRAWLPIEALTEVGVREKSTPALDAVYALPDKYKTVIILHYLEEMSIDEIAAALSLSPSAVKMRLSRGRDKMREIILHS